METQLEICGCECVASNLYMCLTVDTGSNRGGCCFHVLHIVDVAGARCNQAQRGNCEDFVRLVFLVEHKRLPSAMDQHG